MHHKITLLILVSALLLGGGLVARNVAAASTTVVVNGTGDLSDFNPGDGQCDTNGTISGNQCSLRAAIEELNALGPEAIFHRITFNIPGTGPHIIAPEAPLPQMNVPIFIDGTSQPGASCATTSAPANLLIVLDGSNAGDTAGLIFAAGTDISSIRGLAIGNFAREGLVLLSNQGDVSCTYIGVEPDGQTAMGNGLSGIRINGDRNLIGGGSSNARRNLISANGTQGIQVGAGLSNRIENNFIGTTADGMNALGNAGGIAVLGASTLIGARPAQSTSGNLISGNTEFGIRVNGGENTFILGNTIGLAQDGTTPLGNTGNGIEVVGAASNTAIGGTGTLEANRIAYNSGDGVIVNTTADGTPVQATIRGNAIFDNTDLGIGLGTDGVDTNDPGDTDSGENGRQNYPVLTTTPGSLTIDVALDSRPNTQYVIDIYRNATCDRLGHGEGQQYVSTSGIITTDANGRVSLTIPLNNQTSGDYITATATDADGNTSEFSACAMLSQLPPDETPTATLPPDVPPTATPDPDPLQEYTVALPLVVQ